MVWLVTHMWLALGLAALCGLLFGWAVRGLLLNGKARKAVVDRDIALVELEQSKREIDQLYAAQSKLTQSGNSAGDEGLQLELEQRETKLQDISSELAAAHEELGALKKKFVAGTAIAGAAGIAAAVADGNDETVTPDVDVAAPRLDADIVAEDASLEWKNRYLSSRVRQLEGAHAVQPSQPVETASKQDSDQLSEAIARAEEAESTLDAFKLEAEADKKKSIAAALAASATSGVAGALIAHQNSDSDELASRGAAQPFSEKLSWQNNYLRQRLASLESSEHDAELSAPSAQPAETAPTLDTGIESDDPSDAEESLDPTATALIENGVDDDVSAWRSNYLQQRLTYLENNPIADRQALYGAAQAEIPSEAIQVIDTELPDEVAASSEHLPEELVTRADEGEIQTGDLEQELARLRWRNRYLEGRLAYVSGEMPVTDPQLEEVVDGAASELESGVRNDASEQTHADAFLASIGTVDGETSLDAGVDWSDGVSESELDGDDLTKISGIDGSIATKLNALGILHYHQIAGWSADDISRINSELELDGLIEENEWTVQAGTLSIGGDLPT